ncbi:hypothetical protein E5676_scaffold79358G00010 [Cucumis melo var. makuwa]|uniref:Uncharacterized protein n=1 Tax=Cucumis melo var. makuwa TaxID=1194695 RepID=A0A5D3CNI9_CUCMM|nr:hypothetical protein E6C27_scaffold48322G00010 [Cucumis melo var. makuwa]TYK13391.1 hypothetical protein E5676_scaffold79358G00010 [Cucumis melo var. makuwa]
MECNGMDGRGLPAPKSDDSLPRGRTKEGKLQNGAVQAREVDSKQELFSPLTLTFKKRAAKKEGFLPNSRGVSTELDRGWDSFTCITASTTKSSGLNALTTAVQPFLGFVESGFPFTHNGGAAPTRQAATGHNALFAQQIHFEVDLFARPIVGMCTRYHRGPISQ